MSVPAIFAATLGGIVWTLKVPLEWAVCLGLVLLFAHIQEVSDGPLSKTCHVVAKYSYGIYLSNLFACWLAFHVLDLHNLAAQILVAAAVTSVASVACYHLIENPFIEFGKKLSSRLADSLLPSFNKLIYPAQVLLHPWLFARKILGRLKRRMVKPPAAPVMQKINGAVQFEFEPLPFLDDDDFRAMLTRSYDLILCDNFKRFLKPGDIVLDIGANIGYISAMAASRIGPSGEVHGFEPLPECFERLRLLRGINPQYKFHFNNLALGDQEGSLPISYDPQGGSRNATLVPDHDGPVTRSVPVTRLDTYISQNIEKPERIRLIKIDVEGYEFPVLRGAEQFFEKTGCRPLIFCEIKPWEIRKCGFSIEDLERYMQRFGYRAYDSIMNGKRLNLRTMEQMDVVLFKA